MKKIISVFLAVIMLFSAVSIGVYAETEQDHVKIFEVAFTDLPYDVAPYRTDYVGRYMGYEYGVDYWVTITNKDGTTTDVKGWPYSISVFEGDSLEFTVSVADYVEPQSVKMLAYPTDTAASDLYDNVTGEPYSKYFIKKSVGNTYGVRPTEDMTISLSEYHLYNDCFTYNFPTSEYYSIQRVQYNAGAGTPEETYTEFPWGNTQVIYENETMFVEVRIPMDDPDHKYHYDTYQVYYTTERIADAEKTYLKTSEQTVPDISENPNLVAHYETMGDENGKGAEWVDVYKIDNVVPTVDIKVTNVVTYTMAMLKEFFKDFDISNEIDWDSIDFAPMVEYIARIMALIMKILRGFGVKINFGG